MPQAHLTMVLRGPVVAVRRQAETPQVSKKDGEQGYRGGGADINVADKVGGELGERREG